jgi:hypothetical protein
VVCAKAAFEVVARTRNPAAITAATMVNILVVLMIFQYIHIMKVYIKMFSQQLGNLSNVA